MGLLAIRGFRIKAEPRLAYKIKGGYSTNRTAADYLVCILPNSEEEHPVCDQACFDALARKNRGTHRENIP